MRIVMRSKIFRAFVLVVLFASQLLAAGCIDAVLGQLAKELRAGTATQQDLDSLVAFAKGIDPASDTGKGIIASISSREVSGDGLKRASTIISNFPGAADDVFSSLSLFKDKPGFDQLVVGLGNASADAANGSLAELRYAKTQLTPPNVARFQVSLDGVVPDMEDIGGNLHEVKHRDYSTFTDFIIEQDLTKIHDQAVTAFSQLAPGKRLTLAFDSVLPPNAEQLYQQIFADLIASPNFTRVNGF